MEGVRGRMGRKMAEWRRARGDRGKKGGRGGNKKTRGREKEVEGEGGEQ